MGYSKAMLRYKINKTIEQITSFTINLQNLYKGEPITGYTIELLRKANILPAEMYINSTTLHNVWDGRVILGNLGNFGLEMKATPIISSGAALRYLDVPEKRLV